MQCREPEKIIEGMTICTFTICGERAHLCIQVVTHTHLTSLEHRMLLV